MSFKLPKNTERKQEENVIQLPGATNQAERSFSKMLGRPLTEAEKAKWGHAGSPLEILALSDDVMRRRQDEIEVLKRWAEVFPEMFVEPSPEDSAS